MSEPLTSEAPLETWMSASVKLAPGASLNAKVTTELLSWSLSDASTTLTAMVGLTVSIATESEPPMPSLPAASVKAASATVTVALPEKLSSAVIVAV